MSHEDAGHYSKSAADIECIDVIEQLGLGFRLGNAFKYLWRCESKGSKRSDLIKARDYLTREINAMDGIASWKAK